MIESTNNLDLRTVAVEKNTWLLEVPDEICLREGLAPDTLVSITIKNGTILADLIQPTDEVKAAVKHFSERYGEFMEAMKDID